MQAGEVLVKVKKEAMCMAADQDSLAVTMLRLVLELYSKPDFAGQSKAEPSTKAALHMCMRSISYTGCLCQPLVGEASSFIQR